MANDAPAAAKPRGERAVADLRPRAVAGEDGSRAATADTGAGVVRNAEPDPGGDTPRSLLDRTLTFKDAAQLSELPESAIRNWIRRGLLPPGIGVRNGVGEWRFSEQDAIFLAVAGDLSRKLGLQLADAMVVARRVANYALEYVERLPDAAVPNTNVLLSYDDDGRAFACLAQGDTARSTTRRDAPGLDAQTIKALRRPHVVIPATAIVVDVLLRTQSLDGSGDSEAGDA